MRQLDERGDGRQVLAHVALALRRYVDDARRRRQDIPHGVRLLAALLVDVAQEPSAPVRHRQGRALDAVRPHDPDDVGVAEPKLLLSLEDTARHLDVSRRVVERLVAGPVPDLPAVKLGASVKVRRSDLLDYIASLPPRTPPTEVAGADREG